MPGPYSAMAQQYADLYGVPSLWVEAVIQTESSGNPAATRYEARLSESSWGLMQLLESTARNLGYNGPAEGLLDPQTNIDFGTKLIRQLYDRVGEDAAAMYSAYNSGSETLYKTSAQVALNTNHFLANLDALTAQFAESPVVQTAVGSVAGGLILLLLAGAWGGKKDRKKKTK